MKSQEKQGNYRYVSVATGDTYVGGFETKKVAIEWYEKHGKGLEQAFNRKLKLFKSYEILDEEILAARRLKQLEFIRARRAKLKIK